MRIVLIGGLFLIFSSLALFGASDRHLAQTKSSRFMDAHLQTAHILERTEWTRRQNPNRAFLSERSEERTRRYQSALTRAADLGLVERRALNGLPHWAKEVLLARAMENGQRRAHRLALILRQQGIQTVEPSEATGSTEATETAEASGAISGGIGGPLIQARAMRTMGAMGGMGAMGEMGGMGGMDAIDLSAKIAGLERTLDRLRDLRLSAESLPHGSPVKEPIVSSGFGFRQDPFTRRRAFHAGMDFAALKGGRVMATASGIVTRAGWLKSYGKLVEIDHENGFKTRYGHLNAIKVSPGQRISRQEIIGEIGSTGRSTGPHLHYEIKHDGGNIDPARYVNMAL